MTQEEIKNYIDKNFEVITYPDYVIDKNNELFRILTFNLNVTHLCRVIKDPLKSEYTTLTYMYNNKPVRINLFDIFSKKLRQQTLDELLR